MKNLFIAMMFAFGIAGFADEAPTAATETKTDAAAPVHKTHEKHAHKHGKKCGHKGEKHAEHTDYEHDGHHHKAHEGHTDECDGPEKG